MKLHLQQDKMDCGSTCLRMVAAHYKRNFSLQRLRSLSGFSKEGVSLLGIADAAEQIGFKATGVKINVNQLSEVDFPGLAQVFHVLDGVKADLCLMKKTFLSTIKYDSKRF